ncbi:MAG: GNAT family N-acetyltransferase [Oscillospiraceae bacterium]|nr:GNAT family N-acetyltransferase [Oscillospiraceae bacterium]
MTYTIRQAAPSDIRPALDLAMRVFMEFEAPVYGPEAPGNFMRDVVTNEPFIKNCARGTCLLFVALDCSRIVGVIGERHSGEDGHICILFVDRACHRQGIAAALTERMVCALKLRGHDTVTVNSSPYALPFYRCFGFTETGPEQKLDGFIFTPMTYTPGEIWDVYDRDRNKTGRYTERGRPMATGDYHIVVHVWKRNKRGEWLIDKRTPRRQNDRWGGLWETTGGSALAGDDSLAAALRETKEELGITLKPRKGLLFRSDAREIEGHTWFQDAWVFACDGPAEAVTFQPGETCDAMWVSSAKLREMMAAGELLGYDVYPYFDELLEAYP